MPASPRIAVLMDENTHAGGNLYETSKAYFLAVGQAGGLPFGIPFLPQMVATVIEHFDGLLCVGGRFAYPDEWYAAGGGSTFPKSERLAIERELVAGFLERDKPILGICAGMQLLGCLNGCRLWNDVQASAAGLLEHDTSGRHSVTIAPRSRLADLVGASTLTVNSRHREAIGEVSSSVMVSARASDGVIEAIELPSQTFAIGLQWHQEQFWEQNHPGNAVFRGLIDACRPGARHF